MGIKDAIRLDITTSQDLSQGSLSYTTSIARRFRLDSIYIKASVNITETITITIDSKNGANYDTVLLTKSLVADSSFVFRPTGELKLQKGDEIKITITNANTTGTVYVTIKTSEIN